jgi:DNA-directed RNA polymerase subunit RPC12/RpoP
MKCTHCGSLNVEKQDLGKEEYNYNHRFKSKWHKQESQFFCMDCGKGFTAMEKTSGIKDALETIVDFSEWEYKVLNSFNTKLGKGANLLIHKANGQHYRATAFGTNLVNEFESQDVRGYLKGYWRTDKNGDLKLCFNEEKET